MSGGDGNKQKKQDATETPQTVYGGSLQATPTTFQPTLPGFQDMLIKQLMAGFGSGGGTGTDLVSLLSSMYRPMTTYSYQSKPPGQSTEK